MTAPRPEGVDSLAVAQEVDALCDRYEDALRRGAAGPLDDWLPPTGPARAAALGELVRLDLEHRRHAGEAVRAEDYLTRYPELRADATAVARLQATERRASPAEAPTAAADTPPTTPAPTAETRLRTLPAQFGRYRIIKLLGQGGMGAVYLAHDTQLDRPIAIKIMRFGADDPQQVQRFYREARVAAAFTHPNLCPVYDVGERKGIHYLTMPLLGGETLAAHVRREGQLPEATAARQAALIARAVHEAHQAGVIHRDLKPANVMLTERGQPVVMDFGLARRYGPLDPRLTALGALVGTPAYMSPEQIKGGPDEEGPTQDVFSLGVMLYEMLTGKLPFQGDMQQILIGVLTTEPVPPSRHRPGLDPRLERVCMTALAKDPRARFISMEAFAEALEEFTQAPPARPRPVRGRRLLVRAGLLLLALALVPGALALAAVFFHFGGAPASSTQKRMTETEPASGDGHKVPPRPTEPKGDQPADQFRAGSKWVGSFRWKGDTYDRRLEVRIEKREGNRFWGRYDDEGGDFAWDIEGTVNGNVVEWGFTKVIHEKEPVKVVGNGKVQGALKDDRLEAEFRNDSRDALAGRTHATVTLKQAK